MVTDNGKTQSAFIGTGSTVSGASRADMQFTSLPGSGPLGAGEQRNRRRVSLGVGPVRLAGWRGSTAEPGAPTLRLSLATQVHGTTMPTSTSAVLAAVTGRGYADADDNFIRMGAPPLRLPPV